ncbi:uncharacterized protein TNCV_2461741 [Trichonephila clavipes]|nr:uncharacterized protein TNCV_2461741 [Trichonephila clavipes]
MTRYYFSDSYRFCLQHQDGRIHVRWHRGERTLTEWILLHHTCPSPDMMVWGANGYTSRSPLIRIDRSLNRARYISCVLRAVALPFNRESCETLRLSRIMHDRMLPLLFGPSLTWKMFDCCTGLRVHQIFH